MRGEAYTGFWWGNKRERDHLEDPGVDRRKILNRIFTGSLKTVKNFWPSENSVNFLII
jgi:hypothetical protein